VLAAEGIRFTILAPHQVERVPAGGLPGWYRTSGGRRIAVFTYDGAISHDVAFGPLVRDADAWVARLTAGSNELVAVATDGETYGHHHKGGDAVLARVLQTLRRRGDVQVENFAGFLARRPPEEEVRLVAPSSWSCPHGVERWRSDCGCRVHGDRATHQRWRAPLRSALDWLAAELHRVFEREGGVIFSADPWTVRDVYGAVLGAPDDAVTRFLRERLRHPDDRRALARARELLELERHALRMFTSCGWFFDDIAGLESLIVLRSAARAIELAGTAAASLEAGLLERLARAPSNDPAVGTGRELYLQGVKAAPARGVPI
jgi:Domain of unknown function (DUF3536)